MVMRGARKLKNARGWTIPSKLKIDLSTTKANLASLDRAPWDVLTSIELARVLGASIQVLANWRIRGEGPMPAPRGQFRGNKTFYRVFEIDRWLRHLNGEAAEGWRVVADWLHSQYYFPEPLKTEVQTWRVAEQLRRWQVWPLMHKPRRLTPLSVECASAASVK